MKARQSRLLSTGDSLGTVRHGGRDMAQKMLENNEGEKEEVAPLEQMGHGAEDGRPFLMAAGTPVVVSSMTSYPCRCRFV